MQRLVTVTVPIPTGGVTNDPRDQSASVCRACTNFDIVTDRKRAIPYRDSVDGATNQTTQTYQNFAVALRTGSSYSLYALGVDTGTGNARVDYKDLTTGSAHDLDDNAWASTSNNAAGGGSCSFNLFVYYKKTGRIYLDNGSTAIQKYDPSGSSAWVTNEVALSFSKIAQGIVHSQDDILYVPYDNKIATNNNGSWTTTAFTAPSEFYISSICEYGIYLAIACAPLSGIGRSRVLIWDRNTATTTATSNIDWGEGVLQVIEEIQGFLVGVSYANDTTRTTNRVTCRYYAGASGAIPFKEYTQSGGVTLLKQAKQKMNTRIFFMMSVSLNGAQREGVWSISKNPNEGFVVTHERTPNNDTLLTSTGTLRNFIFTGDYLFQAYVNASATEVLSKTNDQSSFTATAVIETIINPSMPSGDKIQRKKLMAVGALYDALPTAGQAIVKAKVNGATSYTTIFTETTDNAVKTEPVPVPSGGSYLNDGEEFEFRLESTGGAVPSYLVYKYAVDETNT